MHILSKLLERTFDMGASSDLGQPFRPKYLNDVCFIASYIQPSFYLKQVTLKNIS